MDKRYIIFFSLYIIFGELTGHLMKYIVLNIFGNQNWNKRPNPCGLNNTGCSMFPTKECSTSIGMPSGHSNSMGFLAMFITLYYTRNMNQNNPKYIIPIIWFISLIVFSQRIIIGCHTPLQVIIGASMGCLWGIIAYNIAHKLFPKEFK